MKFVLILFSILFYGELLAIDFFENDIDYWNEKKSARKENKQKRKLPPKNSFDWKKYKDPKNKEFFKEGKHIPPEPFMELARNPSDQNIKNWFELVEAKNKLMERLHKRMALYLEKNKNKLKTKEKAIILAQTKKLKKSDVDVKRFRFLLYFESTCPHCKNMLETLVKIQNTGFYVEVRQVDKNKPKYPVPFPLIPATKEEIKKKKIESWPVLFVADTENKLIYRINGYFSFNKLMSRLSNK